MTVGIVVGGTRLKRGALGGASQGLRWLHIQTMNSTDRLILDYLNNILPVHPKVEFNTQGERPKGLFAEFRLEGFKNATKIVNIHPKIGTVWSEVSCKAYEINDGRHYLDLIIALYDESIVLWLDDETDDRDFTSFVRREKLWSWLGTSVNNLIELLLESKLSYLGQPQLIHNIADIPQVPEDDWTWVLANMKGAQKEFDAYKERQERVTPLIRPPEIIRDSNEVSDLRFCIWTKVLGRVYDIHCSFGPSNPFVYKGILLAEWVGRGFAPR